MVTIRAGRPINDGKRMAETTLMAMMGRMAAYTGQRITWQQALQSEQELVPENLDSINGLVRFIGEKQKNSEAAC